MRLSSGVCNFSKSDRYQSQYELSIMSSMIVPFDDEADYETVRSNGKICGFKCTSQHCMNRALFNTRSAAHNHKQKHHDKDRERKQNCKQELRNKATCPSQSWHKRCAPFIEVGLMENNVSQQRRDGVRCCIIKDLKITIIVVIESLHGIILRIIFQTIVIIIKLFNL